ncbi:hypothetical protein, partial [Ferrimicrobium acidiphilum]|uniref:hypothetical protein n=1 Tax=Ferrimicrobium acidiphilum TaxID=121039 RepID=UPI0023F49A11
VTPPAGLTSSVRSVGLSKSRDIVRLAATSKLKPRAPTEPARVDLEDARPERLGLSGDDLD